MGGRSISVYRNIRYTVPIVSHAGIKQDALKAKATTLPAVNSATVHTTASPPTAHALTPAVSPRITS